MLGMPYGWAICGRTGRGIGDTLCRGKNAWLGRGRATAPTQESGAPERIGQESRMPGVGMSVFFRGGKRTARIRGGTGCGYGGDWIRRYCEGDQWRRARAAEMRFMA